MSPFLTLSTENLMKKSLVQRSITPPLWQPCFSFVRCPWTKISYKNSNFSLKAPNISLKCSNTRIIQLISKPRTIQAEPQLLFSAHLKNCSIFVESAGKKTDTNYARTTVHGHVTFGLGWPFLFSSSPAICVRNWYRKFPLYCSRGMSITGWGVQIQCDEDSLRMAIQIT